MGTPTKRTKKTRSRLGRGLSALVDPATSIPIEILPELSHKQKANILESLDPEFRVRPTDDGASPPNPEEVDGALGERILEISIGDVVPNPHQPRREFSEESLDELGQSILDHGLMQPIVVRRGGGGGAGEGDGSRGGFELIAGERRWRAARRAGLSSKIGRAHV